MLPGMEQGRTAVHPCVCAARLPVQIMMEVPDDMTSARAIHLNGNSHSLRVHYADRLNIAVDAERYVSRIPTRGMTGIVYSDLLIASDADRDALERSNACVVSEQGKPPDFVLVVASLPQFPPPL